MFIACTSTVLGVNGFLRVRREVGLFASDRVRDQELMASVLARAATESWRTDGPARAIAMVDELGSRSSKLRIHWVPFSDGIEPTLLDRLKELGPGRTLTVSEPPSAPQHCIYATLTVSPPTGAISLCESSAAQEAYVRKTIAETIVTTLTLAAACALLSALVGVWLVGTPIAALSAKARRIGEGDFSDPLALRSKDELANLASEMNAMCERLAAASRRVVEETANRIAAVEQLRHADRLTTVGKLASGLAHELGTPLNVIEARSDMIASGETSLEESRDYARVIRVASERMTALVRQLLDFARPRMATPAPHDARKLVERTIDMLAPLASKKRAEVVLASGEPTTAFVDPDQLEQVIANLIVNAIQAMDRPGKVEVNVTTDVAHPPADHGGPQASYVCISVRDQGRGIAPEHVDHVFEPFFTTKDVGSGTGLGLAVAYGIVRDHGGWIEVESEPGKGSVFRVFLRPGAT